jgi:hypothetical protein
VACEQGTAPDHATQVMAALVKFEFWVVFAFLIQIIVTDEKLSQSITLNSFKKAKEVIIYCKKDLFNKALRLDLSLEDSKCGKMLSNSGTMISNQSHNCDHISCIKLHIESAYENY